MDAAIVEEKRAGLRRRLHRWFLIQAYYTPEASSLRWFQAAYAPITRAPPSISNDEDEEDEESIQESQAMVDGVALPPFDPDTVALLLPSSLPPEIRQHGMAKELAEMERRLRVAELEGSLRKLRHFLRIKSGIYQFKSANIVGQKSSTRAQAVLSSLRMKISKALRADLTTGSTATFVFR